MKKDPNHNLGKDPLPKEEWDFSEIDDEELDECYIWEYGREIDSWKDKVIKQQQFMLKKASLLGKNLKGNKFDDFFYITGNDGKPRSPYLILPRGLDTVFQERVYLFLYSPEWPNKPYLSLIKEERRRRISMRWAGFLEDTEANKNVFMELTGMQVPLEYLINDDLIKKKFQYGEEETQDNRKFRPVTFRYDSGKSELAVFNIDWTKPDTLLVKYFKGWLNLYRPSNGEAADRRGGGGEIKKAKAKLKVLGAYRLLQNMKWSDAADYTENECGKHFYDNQSAWSRAKKEAVKEIQVLSSKEYF